VTCSAVSCMSTGELHELVYAPHKLLLALLDLTAEPDDHVVGEDRAVDGDRAELRPVDPGLHGALPALGRAGPLSAHRPHKPTTRGLIWNPSDRIPEVVIPDADPSWSTLTAPRQPTPSQRQAIAVTPSVLSGLAAWVVGGRWFSSSSVEYNSH